LAEAFESAARLPAHLEVSALLRQVQAEGGFATVLAKGEPDAGTILLVLTERGGDSRAFERMPQADGRRIWTQVMAETGEGGAAGSSAFAEWIARRRRQDPDLWILELDIPQGERFIL